MTDAFDDAAAFRRNLGWITETEQSLLRGGCGWDEVLLACADGAAWRAEAATRGNEG